MVPTPDSTPETGASGIHLITPAGARDNNGNWQTARRWTRFLSGMGQVDVAKAWQAQQHAHPVMIALHARRSAEAIAAYAQAGRALACVLTGTDLYRDIRSDADAQRSLALADVLVVLNEEGRNSLPPQVRDKARVIVQSAPARKALPLRRRRRHFDCALVGHLRSEKDPLTALRAFGHLARAGEGLAGGPPPVRLIQIGDLREEALRAPFEALAQGLPSLHRLGPLPHAATRRWIGQSQLLLLPSRMEGGANVLIEAVTSGVPVLASNIEGSRGLLGADYAGYFEPGDDKALAALILRCRDDAGFHEHLARQCAARAAGFAPAREREAVRQLVRDLRALAERAQAAGAAPSWLSAR